MPCARVQLVFLTPTLCDASVALADGASIARDCRRQHEQSLVGQIVDLPSIPGLGTATANIRSKAEHISKLLDSSPVPAGL